MHVQNHEGAYCLPACDAMRFFPRMPVWPGEVVLLMIIALGTFKAVLRCSCRRATGYSSERRGKKRC